MPETNAPWRRIELPRPFYDEPWKGETLAAAQTLWEWHQRLLPDLEAGRAVDSLRDRALEVARAHALDEADVLVQEEAARELAAGFRVADPRALDALIDRWTAAHGRLLAGLAGIGRYSWQPERILMMARGFAITAALMALPQDSSAGRILIPRSDLDDFGVPEDDLLQGRVTPGVKKVIWKVMVRARDSFARGQALVDDLDRRQAAAFRRWWFAGLEMLDVIERNDFDVWSKPPRLSAYRRMHARYQARFGRATFR